MTKSAYRANLKAARHAAWLLAKDYGRCLSEGDWIVWEWQLRAARERVARARQGIIGRGVR